MAFADGQTAAAIFYGSEPAEVYLKDTVVKGDILGYSGGWKRALATTGTGLIQGRCVASDAGDSGEKIQAYFGICVLGGGRFSGGTKDASLYVAEGTDEGKYTETVPDTTGDATKKVGVVIDDTKVMVFPNRDVDSTA